MRKGESPNLLKRLYPICEKMKRKRFTNSVLLFAIANFVANKRNVQSSIFLMLAAVYALTEILPELWKEWKHAKR